MQEDTKFYSVSENDNLKTGEEIIIKRSISLNNDNADFSKIQNLSVDALQKKREESADKEKVIFEKLQTLFGDWEAQAANTKLIDKTLEFAKVAPIEHTSNEWVIDCSGENWTNYKISNMTYRMFYRIYNETKFDGTQGKLVPNGCTLSWSVYTNAPMRPGYHSNIKIDGQENKRFTEKAIMEKYLEGRIAAYKDLFTEISPPIPKNHSEPFHINGILLNGYSIKNEQKPTTGITVTVSTVRRRKPPKKSVPTKGGAR